MNEDYIENGSEKLDRDSGDIIIHAPVRFYNSASFSYQYNDINSLTRCNTLTKIFGILVFLTTTSAMTNLVTTSIDLALDHDYTTTRDDLFAHSELAASIFSLIGKLLAIFVLLVKDNSCLRIISMFFMFLFTMIAMADFLCLEACSDGKHVISPYLFGSDMAAKIVSCGGNIIQLLISIDLIKYLCMKKYEDDDNSSTYMQYSEHSFETNPDQNQYDNIGERDSDSLLSIFSNLSVEKPRRSQTL